MHNEQVFFVHAVRHEFPNYFFKSSVLEIGSYNVNGTLRSMFIEPRKYVGVDLIEGPCVDYISRGKDYKDGHKYNTVFSTEVFEHDPEFLDTFKNMVDHSADGGLVFFTCATTGRPEHGTRRTSPHDSPGTFQTGLEDYYRNVTVDDFKGLVETLHEKFEAFMFLEQQSSHDLYFVGVRRGSVLDPTTIQLKMDIIAARICPFNFIARDVHRAIYTNEQVQGV